MKMYEGKGGQFYGTQADAKTAVGKGNFTEVDVPTDKAGLISYLNQRANAYDDLRPVEQTGTPTLIGEPLAFLDIRTGASAPLERATHSINVENEIAKADYSNAVRLAMHATSRVGEHLKALADKEHASKLADMLS